MRWRWVAAAAAAVVAATSAAAPNGPGSRYDGPRLAFEMPARTSVKEATDVVADYALDLTLPADAPLKQTILRLLLSNGKVVDFDVEGVATAWRNARVRNRASWGVHKRREERPEITHILGRRFVRLVDELGSVLGASSQVMLCGSISAHLVCGVASGPSADAHAREALLVRILESLTVKKARPASP